MTKGIEDMLNLPSMNDVLNGETDDDISEDVLNEPDPDFLPDDTNNVDDEIDENQKIIDDAMKFIHVSKEKLSLIDGADHGTAMDEIYDEVLKHARDVMEFGFNIDRTKAARMFEVSGNMYKIAIDAKNSKREAQLKQMRLMLEQQKIDIQKQVAGDAIDNPGNGETYLVANRNDIIDELNASKNKNTD